MKSTQEIFVRYFTGSQVLKLDCNGGCTTIYTYTYISDCTLNVGEFYGMLVIPL